MLSLLIQMKIFITDAEVNSNRQVNDGALIQSNSIGIGNATNGNSKGKLHIFMIHTNWCPHSVNALPGFKDLMNEVSMESC